MYQTLHWVTIPGGVHQLWKGLKYPYQRNYSHKSNLQAIWYGLSILPSAYNNRKCAYTLTLPSSVGTRI